MLKITKAMIGLDSEITQDIAAFLKHMAQLRRALDEAETRFMLTLLYLEQNITEGQLKKWGHESFDGFVNANSEQLCKPSRYRDWLAGFAKIADLETVVVIGVAGTTHAASVPKIGLDRYIIGLKQWAKEAGSAPSNQIAERQAHQAGAPLPEARSYRDKREIDRVRAELASEKARVRALESQLKRAQKEIESLRKENKVLKTRRRETA